MTEFAFGFLNRTVKNHEYTYFWTYDGAGHKTETYLGRAGKPKTQKRALMVKLAYFQGLEQELAEMIRQTKAELEQLAPGEAPKT